MISFDTDRLIIIYFPECAGGKFLSNCLSLSRHAVAQNKWVAAHDLSYTGYNIETFLKNEFKSIQDKYEIFSGSDWPTYSDFINSNLTADFPFKNEIFSKLTRYKHAWETLDYYEFKLQSVMESLPDAENVKNWLQYEYGEHIFFELNNHKYTELSAEEIKLYPFNQIISAITDTDKYFFLGAHGKVFLDAYLKVWPNAKIINFVNYKKFQKLSLKLKDPTHELTDTEQLTELKNYTLNFDVDNTYFDKESFLLAIKKLYLDLDMDDFNKDLVEEFYTAYIKLHHDQ
jgi:hypothetical protein